GVDQRGDVRPRLLHPLLGLPAERMRAARRVAEDLREVRDHLLRDPRVDRRSRRVVEIDRQLHGYAAAFSSGALRNTLICATCLPFWCATRSASDTDER